MWQLVQASISGVILGTMWCAEDIAGAIVPAVHRKVAAKVGANIGWFFWFCVCTGFMMHTGIPKVNRAIGYDS